jgi:hypothetical protein
MNVLFERSEEERRQIKEGNSRKEKDDYEKVQIQLIIRECL